MNVTLVELIALSLFRILHIELYTTFGEELTVTISADEDITATPDLSKDEVTISEDA